MVKNILHTRRGILKGGCAVGLIGTAGCLGDIGGSEEDGAETSTPLQDSDGDDSSGTADLSAIDHECEAGDKRESGARRISCRVTVENDGNAPAKIKAKILAGEGSWTRDEEPTANVGPGEEVTLEPWILYTTPDEAGDSLSLTIRVFAKSGSVWHIDIDEEVSLGGVFG